MPQQLEVTNAIEWMIHPDHLPNLGLQAMGWRERVLNRHGISDEPDVVIQNDVAVVKVDGLITRRAQWMQIYYDGVSTEGLTAAINRLAADGNVAAIVIHVDTPGGEAMGMPALADAVKNAAARKPVYVHADGLLASGGYYMAANATKIFAEGVDNYIGSIGTLIMFYDYSEAFKQAGIEPVIIATGEYKATGTRGAKVTDEQKAYLQQRVDALQSRFSKTVMGGRGLSREQLAEVADGRVFEATEAMKLGLIDGVQPLEKTLRQVKQQVKNQGGAKVSVTENPAVKSAATMEELELIPGATNDFIVEAMKGKWTYDKASSTWMERQQAALAESKKKLEESEAQREELAKNAAGGKPGNLSDADKSLGDRSGGSSHSAGGDGGSAITRWEAAIKAKVDGGMDPREAVRAVTRENPELHTEYLEEYSELHPPASVQLKNARPGGIK